MSKVRMAEAARTRAVDSRVLARRRHDNRLTDEEKEHWEPMLHNTWQAIAPDATPMLSKGNGRQGELIEIVCDANMPMTYGGMTAEEYRVFSRAYSHADTQKWLRSILNY